MSNELLFDADHIRITRRVAHFGETSYQIANIGSIRIVRNAKANRLAVTFLIIGLALLGLAWHQHKGDVAIAGAAFLFAALLVQVVWPRREFILVLKTSSGDIEALISRKHDLVTRVKQAIESAFAARN